MKNVYGLQNYVLIILYFYSGKYKYIVSIYEETIKKKF